MVLDAMGSGPCLDTKFMWLVAVAMKQAIISKYDQHIIKWMRDYGHVFVRLSLGIIFIWFGALKFYPNTKINDIVARTVYWFDPAFFIPVLAVWEIIIGAGLLFRVFLKATLVLLFFQMIGSFLPLIILPNVCFIKPPFILTIEGQYIVKNLIIISSAIVIGGTIELEPGQRKTEERKGGQGSVS